MAHPTPMAEQEWVKRWAEAAMKMCKGNSIACSAVMVLFEQRQIAALLRLEALEFDPQDLEALYRMAGNDGVRLIEILALWSDKRLMCIRQWSGKYEEGGCSQ